jgi:hypothetical protein
MFQRTPFSLVIKAFTDRLNSVGLDLNWFGLQGAPQFWLGDYQICLKPGQGAVDEGTMLGTGIPGCLIKRPIVCTLMSRSYEDEGERATQALYDHLAIEELLIAACHLYMPNEVNSIVVEPFKLSGTQEPQQKGGILSSQLVFDALYPALLELPQPDNSSELFLVSDGTPFLWGIVKDGHFLHGATSRGNR